MRYALDTQLSAATKSSKNNFNCASEPETTDNIFLFGCRCVTLIIQQHILRLEVSVEDPPLVEVLQALDDLSSIVTGSRLLKPRLVLIHVINVIPSSIREGVHLLYTSHIHYVLLENR